MIYFYVFFSMGACSFVQQYVGKRNWSKAIDSCIDYAGALFCFWLVTHMTVAFQ